MPENNFVNVMLISGNINYFNRIIKKYDTLEEYQALGSYYNTTVNFDPGNNLQTTLVIGTTGTNKLTFDCNYLLVYTTANNVDTIEQRWWVMDQKRNRAGQYTLSLKRDVIADFYDIVVNSPCFIEKATIRNNDNPLLYNKEDMEFNQIKKQEKLLQDETKMAWLVGYVARNYSGGSFDSVYDVRTDYTDTTLPFQPGTYKAPSNIKLNLFYENRYTYQGVLRATHISKSYIEFANGDFNNYTSFYKELTYKLGTDTSKNVYYNSYGLGPNAQPVTPSDPTGYLEKVGDYIVTNKATIQPNFQSTYSYTAQEDMDEISNLAGKTYHDTQANKYYKIKINISSQAAVKDVKSFSAFGVAINTGVRKPVTDEMLSLTDNYDNVNGYTTIECYEKTIVMTLEEYNPISLKISLSSSRNRLNDAPYDLFAIPYPLSPTAVITSYTNYLNFQYFYINKEDSLHIAQAIAAELGPNAFVYDIQILPYCPITNLMGNFETIENGYEDLISLIGLTENKDYNLVKTNETTPKTVGVVLWGTKSGRTFNIYEQINISNPKIENETKMYRIVSPNYSGMFEFSPAKNQGVDYFNVDITFKPYQPYIHVNPNFRFLYGTDFNDIRGLICGGDFSIALVDDKWANFQINNKNYQLIFDREVQNLEFTRDQDRVLQAVGALGGTVAASVQGGMVGGAAGAIVGGVASAAGGVIDFAMSEARYKENLNLKKDLYSYNLGNIKALPASLAKSMSLNENFKFWPFLEEYDCTDLEKEALELKLRYDGMTIMKIDKIINYLVVSEETFIKGQVIRLENLPEASDVAYEIYNEIKRGVFI